MGPLNIFQFLKISKILNVRDLNKPDDQEFFSGAIVAFKDDPDRWGVVSCVSDCGTCVYVKRYGKGTENSIGLSGIDRSLLCVK
jgi:hypothetical protein